MFAIGRTTAEAPSMNTEDYLHYTELNLKRTSRVEKTIKLSDDMKTALDKITTKQHWVVLAESWCGDVPHNLPVIHKMAVYQSLIELHILLRDQNLDIMDAYLTNGGRSIPKLIAFDQTLEKELFTWGPRPEPLTHEIGKLKEVGAEYPEIIEASQKWYNKDKAATLQREFIELIRKVTTA